MGLTTIKYKQTKVGLIPEDWSVQPLKKYLLENPKYGLGAAAVDFNSNYPTYLRITDIDEAGNLIKEGLKSVDHLDSSKYFLEEGEIVFARTGASVGKSYLFNKKDGALVYAGFLIKIKPDPKKLSPNYLSNYVTTAKYWDWVAANSLRSGQPGINSQEYGSLPIPVPPTLNEQKAIAQVLSDTNSLIQALEKKIAKKKLIKKGVMQKLLTPKKDWEVKNLGEIAEIYTGKKNNQDKVENGRYPFFVRSQIVESINTYSFDGEAILVPGEGNIGKIFHYINGKFDFHQRVYKISDFKDGYNGKYIYRYISEYFGMHAMENSVKATVDSLRLSTFEAFQIPFPPTFEEQILIAKILGDIDKEIENLEKKLSKYQLAKQGMMQQLLTGKIRLV